MVSDAGIKEILENYRTVAVVGLSREKTKDSHIVASYLQGKGYRIIPVNPFAREILGERTYGSILEIPEDLQKKLEIVDIFRPSGEVVPIVDEAVQIKKRYDNLKVVWMQLGIMNEEAARKAEAAGLKVVMNRCMMVEHGRLMEKEGAEIEQKKVERKTGEPVQLTDSNFDEKVNEYDLAVVDFWAPWCGTCKVVSSLIEELSKEYTDNIIFGKLKVDENPGTADRFSVISVPAVVFLKNGKEVDRITGVVAKSFMKKTIEKHSHRIMER